MRTIIRFIIIAIGGLFALAAVATESSNGSTKTPAIAIFAGGCFWCMQPPFDKLAGVASTTVGYTGGQKPNPTYQEVSAGGSGHQESIQIAFDPAKISYRQLLDVYWHNIDPLDSGGQFCDHGDSYRAVIFYGDDEQKRMAEASKADIEKTLGRSVVTAILPAREFYAAEDYHQSYYQKNPLRYKYYRYRCGRDQRLEQVWGKAAAAH
ncbi:MAG: peptide-methionine (S)-S-oxide reductase MsrA [Gammaproteobacteria bacterium]|nr:peptide-methionine (S)-S-oxide reductase MsrA [Gammaproteobacteria bacterium]